jgi:hypothetical protein
LRALHPEFYPEDRKNTYEARESNIGSTPVLESIYRRATDTCPPSKVNLAQSCIPTHCGDLKPNAGEILHAYDIRHIKLAGKETIWVRALVIPEKETGWGPGL